MNLLKSRVPASAIIYGAKFWYVCTSNTYCCLDTQGNTVASYTYDAFGNTISQSGPMSDFFLHRFSTKYYDSETGLYYYGYRYYSPVLMRWLTRDPIEEAGGVNLYAMCGNNAINRIDFLGLYLWYIIYYDENSVINNFKKAAETCEKNIKSSPTYNHTTDNIEIYGVRTADDFFNIWIYMNMHSRKKLPAIPVIKYEACIYTLIPDMINCICMSHRHIHTK